jgi:hypothetical protein
MNRENDLNGRRERQPWRSSGTTTSAASLACRWIKKSGWIHLFELCCILIIIELKSRHASFSAFTWPALLYPILLGTRLILFHAWYAWIMCPTLVFSSYIFMLWATVSSTELQFCRSCCTLTATNCPEGASSSVLRLCCSSVAIYIRASN